MERKGSGVRSWILGVTLVLGLVVMFSAAGFAASSASGGDEPLRITLRVHDYAGVPSEVLADSFLETARILHLAGVEVSFLLKEYTDVPRNSFGAHWARNAKKLQRTGLQTDFVDCSPSASATEEDAACQRVDPAVLVVSLVPRDMVAKYGVPAGTFGLTPMKVESTRFTHAYVFYDLIEEFCQHEEVSRPLLLGLAVAHEIGHLLLGTNSHSSRGLMRIPWSAPDLCFTCRPKLVFTTEQSQNIRSAVRARKAQEETTPSAPLASQK